jgi:hypothetical protein
MRQWMFVANSIQDFSPRVSIGWELKGILLLVVVESIPWQRGEQLGKKAFFEGDFYCD